MGIDSGGGSSCSTASGPKRFAGSRKRRARAGLSGECLPPPYRHYGSEGRKYSAPSRPRKTPGQGARVQEGGLGWRPDLSICLRIFGQSESKVAPKDGPIPWRGKGGAFAHSANLQREIPGVHLPAYSPSRSRRRRRRPQKESVPDASSGARFKRSPRRRRPLHPPAQLFFCPKDSCCTGGTDPHPLLPPLPADGERGEPATRGPAPRAPGCLGNHQLGPLGLAAGRAPGCLGESSPTWAAGSRSGKGAGSEAFLLGESEGVPPPTNLPSPFRGRGGRGVRVLEHRARRASKMPSALVAPPRVRLSISA